MRATLGARVRVVATPLSYQRSRRRASRGGLHAVIWPGVAGCLISVRNKARYHLELAPPVEPWCGALRPTDSRASGCRCIQDLVRGSPYRVALRQTERVEPRECPTCRTIERLVVVEAAEPGPLELSLETLYRCPRCRRLAVRAGLLKRVGGLMLMLPFLGLIGAALVAALWMLWSMLAAGALEVGFVIVALLLITAAILAARPALRTLGRLLRPQALLPLSRSAPDDNELWSEL